MTPAWEMNRETTMTGIDPERRERRLRWAAEQLGLNPHASAEEIRAAMLQRLPDEDFVPLSEDRGALAALLRRPAEGGWEARADQEAYWWEQVQLRGEVEAFAQQFWDVPAEERRRRWEALADRCAFAPALRARLRLLEVGLDCDAHLNEAEVDSRVIELANHVRELFVLRPGSRARTRQAILRRMTGSPKNECKEWKAAARRLRRAHPKFASLANDLLDKVEKATAKSKRVRKKLPAMTTARNTGGNSSRWPMWVTIGIVVGIVRACSTISNPPTPPQSTTFQLPERWKDTLEKQKIDNEKWKEDAKRIIDKLDKQKERQGQERDKNKSDKLGGKSP